MIYHHKWQGVYPAPPLSTFKDHTYIGFISHDTIEMLGMLSESLRETRAALENVSSDLARVTDELNNLKLALL